MPRPSRPLHIINGRATEPSSSISLFSNDFYASIVNATKRKIEVCWRYDIIDSVEMFSAPLRLGVRSGCWIRRSFSIDERRAGLQLHMMYYDSESCLYPLQTEFAH